MCISQRQSLSNAYYKGSILRNNDFGVDNYCNGSFFALNGISIINRCIFEYTPSYIRLHPVNMPSRKRSKGKARRARAAASSSVVNKNANDIGEVQMLNTLSLKQDKRCSHGRPRNPSDECTRFMASYEAELKYLMNAQSSLASIGALSKASKTVKVAKSDVDDVSACILSLGVDYVLRGDFDMATTIAMSLVQLRHSNFFGSSVPSSKAIQKVVDLSHEGIRETIAFYSKRIDCSCLKDHSKALKSLPAMGNCFYCKTIRPRKELLICSRCRTSRYCSTTCQAAEWPEHKTVCKGIELALIRVEKETDSAQN